MAAISALEGRPWHYGLVVGLLIAAAIIGVGWWQLLGPMNEEIEAKDARLAELEQKIQEGRAAKQRLPQFREEVRRLELELDKLLRILPARLNTEDLLRRFRALAEQGDLDLISIRPGSRQERDFYSEWPIDISVTGTYHNLALFFDRIGRFSRIINVDDLRIQSVDPRQSGGHSISSDFRAKTFIYRDVPLEEEQQEGEGAEGASP